MRICPQCRAFYADAQLAFCLADGTPLIGIKPGSEKWHEGSRVIEEKAKGVSRQRRRLKWRRVAFGAMTTLILTMVVVTSITVETTTTPPGIPPVLSPSPAPSVTSSSLPSPSPSSSPSPSPSPSPSISPTPTPIPVYTISGTVTSTGQPLSGVDIKLAGAKTDTTKTDWNGRYAFSGLQAGGNYTVTATRTQVIFAPASRSLNSLAKDESADFSAEVVKISGRVTKNNQPLGGVKVLLEGSKATSTTTDGNGYYTFGDLRAGGSYTVTPQGQGKFAPSRRSFDNLRRDESADFTVATEVFKISGRVRSFAGPHGGVTVSITGSKSTSTATDGNGYYSFGDLRGGGSYTITPKGQMEFHPTSRYFDKLQRDESADFVIRDVTPTPTPKPTPKSTPTPTPTPRPTPTATPPREECSEADQAKAFNSLRSLEPSWRRQIMGERARVISENQGAEASLGEIEFRYSFPKPCKAAVVSARYAWLVRTAGNVDFPGKSKNVPRQRIITCGKFLGAWVCR